MAPNEIEIKVELARQDGRLIGLEARMTAVEALAKLITDLRVDLAGLRSQLKVTWALMMLIIAGLVTVAYTYMSVGRIAP